MSEYDDEEWLEGDDADADYESEPEGSVHPLPTAHAEVHALNGVAGVEKLRHVPSTAVLSATSESDAGGGEDEPGGDELKIDVRHSAYCEATYPDDVVRLHARRADGMPMAQKEVVAPPPAPMIATVIANIGNEASMEAHKRAVKYRRRVAQQQEEQKIQKARDTLAAKQIRTMFKDFNRTIGVADVPSDKRFEEAVRAQRVKKLLKEREAAEETAARWYRKVQRPTRSEYSAADFGAKILQEARRDHHAQLQAKALHRRVINEKLQQLSLDAKRIVTQNVGGYERGSFLLKCQRERVAPETNK